MIEVLFYPKKWSKKEKNIVVKATQLLSESKNKKTIDYSYFYLDMSQR